MKQRESEPGMWLELLAAALKPFTQTVQAAAPPVEQRNSGNPLVKEAEAQREPRATGIIQDLSRAVEGPVPSIISRVSTPGGSANWLRWLNPIAGLISLFGGRESQEQAGVMPVLSPRPPKRRVEYGLPAPDAGTFASIDTDERGRVRLGENLPAAPAQVVVQVQTMDSRSFLDHRDDIASAVRQALMESHSLGTVLREFRE